MIAVTGITGHSGGFFLQELIAQHYTDTVRCLVRETSDTTALDCSGLAIEKVVGDLSDEQTLRCLLQGADAVLHITNVRYSPKVLEVAALEKVKRIVLVHTTGIYSKYKQAAGEYLRIETDIKAFLENRSLDVTILRPTMIFGDLCDHNIHRFVRMVDKLPFMPEINHGAGKIRPVNARDLGKAYYQVCMTSHLPELAYDLSGEYALSLHELFDSIGRYLGKKVKHVSCPMWLGHLGAQTVKTVSLGRVDFVEKVLRMGEDRDYGHEEATRDFGYLPEPFQTGLKREVEEYKASHG